MAGEREMRRHGHICSLVGLWTEILELLCLLMLLQVTNTPSFRWALVTYVSYEWSLVTYASY